MKKRTCMRMIATAMSLTLALSACQSTKSGRSNRGGTLSIAAWEPECADPLLPCSFNAWGGAFPTMTAHTLPRVFDSRNGHYYVPSALFAGAPNLSAGPPQKVTYHINHKARWSDGQPITSSDFRFTWQSVIHEKDVGGDPTGYNQIENVDDSDPHTAVVTFKSPYASWQDLFGPVYGILPQHLLANRDRHAEMKEGYRWSRGPWLIQSWTKGQSGVLVPNRRYWDERPKLDRVVFTFVTDNSAEEQAYRTGQVQVIAPIGRSSRADLRSFPNTNFSITPSNNFEVMTFNTQRPPLNDKAVRQALAYATDRTSIATTVFPLAARYEPLDSFLSPANPYYVTPFRRYQRNLQKVDEIMQADGWSRGQDGIWTRQGQRAAVEFTTSDAFPPGRAEIEGNMLKAEWQEAGFDVTAKPSPSQAFFGDILPNAKFSTATYYNLWGQTFSPADCGDWCSENIAPAGFASNYSLFRSQTLDDLFHKIAGELDETRRKALVAQAQGVLADEVPSLPIASTPTVIYWRTSVRGPIGPNEPLGPFVNLNQWYCAGGHCEIPGQRHPFRRSAGLNAFATVLRAGFEDDLGGPGEIPCQRLSPEATLGS